MTDRPLLPIFEGHNDTLLRLYGPKRNRALSFFTRGDQGHLDLPRAREGGLAGGFFAIFVPPAPQTYDEGGANLTYTRDGYTVRMAPPLDLAYAQQFALSVAGSLLRLEAESAGQCQVVRSADQL